jgi:hypothetical protein
MDKAERLKRLLDVATEDRPSTKEVAGLLSTLIKQVRETLDKTKGEMMKCMEKVSHETLMSVNEKVASMDTMLQDCEKRLNKAIKTLQTDNYKLLNNEVYKLEQAIKDIKPFDATTLENKWAVRLLEVETRIDEIKQLSAYEVRDLIESLPDGEKVVWSAIQGVVGIHVGKTPPEDKDMLWLDTTGGWVEMK